MTTRRWSIDTSHSGIQFMVRHMVIARVRGAFDRWQGTVEFDPAEPTASKVSVRIESASINTNEPQRDGHLRSPDFLDVGNHSAITFESRKVEKLAGDRYRVLGDLTIRGVTRPVELDAEYFGAANDPWGNQRIGLHAKTAINRKDFGLNWNQALEAGGVLVGEQVEIALDVEAVSAQAVGQAA